MNNGDNNPTFVYAGFWLRFVAFILDALISYPVFFAVSVVIYLVSGGFEYIKVWMYVFPVIVFLVYTLMESSSIQATPAKIIFRIKVTDIQGNRITFARSFTRNLIKALSGFTLYLAYLPAAFTSKKQALHDIIADTLVVRS